MSANYRDLLKYATTGIASPSMTHYDKMRASTLMGGVVQTLTGQPPISFLSDGTPLTSVTIKGNGSQTGTPTPDNPIQPDFCGVRTGNLWDEDYTGISSSLKYKPIFVGDGTFTMYTTCPLASGNATIFLLSGNVSSGASTSTNGVSNTRSRSAKSISGYVTIAYRFYGNTNPSDFDTILNAGTEPLPYEPYGWAEKITCAGQTTPLYLGQTQTVRKIRKLVLTGEENWQIYTSAPNTYRVSISNTPSIGNHAMCSHFVNSPIVQIASGKFTVGSTWIYIRYADVADLADFKSYLAAQYAAGTPVTVWYVLATPETAIVNEPLAKIGDYADTLTTDTPIPTAKGSNTLSVDTTVQPSEVSITGNIKPTT